MPGRRARRWRHWLAWRASRCPPSSFAQAATRGHVHGQVKLDVVDRRPDGGDRDGIAARQLPRLRARTAQRRRDEERRTRPVAQLRAADQLFKLDPAAAASSARSACARPRWASGKRADSAPAKAMPTSTAPSPSTAPTPARRSSSTSTSSTPSRRAPDRCADRCAARPVQAHAEEAEPRGSRGASNAAVCRHRCAGARSQRRCASPGPASSAGASTSNASRSRAGESVFLHGPSGCGKSTLLSLMAGVLRADSGPRAAARATTGRSCRARRATASRVDHVGYIFQQFNLLPYLSVIDNVLLPCRFSAARWRRRAHGKAARARPRAPARRMGLGAELWQRQAMQLSVGQQQRVAAARALIGQPELVIADEPTSALDEDRREAFLDVLLPACAAHRQRAGLRQPRPAHRRPLRAARAAARDQPRAQPSVQEARA